ncbi:MAG: enoyl-CoA hydratase-related protein, partial [Desulfobacterales bacterium]|nr:enoyl-CoA hydratase-related protein [Desulfobacterales bacterium]
MNTLKTITYKVIDRIARTTLIRSERKNDMSYENVLYEVRDGIGLLTLNRPEALNSLNTPLMNDILSVLKQVAEDPKTRVLVMTGAGKGFCSGADLDPIGKPGDKALDSNMSLGEMVSENMKTHFNPLVLEIHRLEKPVIAAVNGVTAGGGVGLALTADMVIAARSAY